MVLRPQIADSHEIALFRSSDFPGDWRRVGPWWTELMDWILTVFRHEHLWWLLCTDRVRGPNTKLWACMQLICSAVVGSRCEPIEDRCSIRAPGRDAVRVSGRPLSPGTRRLAHLRWRCDAESSALVDPYVIRRRGRRNSAPGSERSLPGWAPHYIVEWNHDRYRWKADALHLERLSSRMARSSSTVKAMGSR